MKTLSVARNVTSTIEERLRILRRSHGTAIGLPDLPAVQFAALAGITPAAYLAFEAGEREPSIAALTALRGLTGVSLDWLIEGDQPALPAQCSLSHLAA